MITPNSQPTATLTLASQQRLARACGTGDPAAWTALVHAHSRRLLTLAHWLGGSGVVAERAVTETFIAAARAWERADPSLPLAVWLARACYKLTERAPSGPPGQSAEAAAFLDAGHRDVAAGLAELPFELRAAVVLRCVVGFDAQDAATIMAVPHTDFEQRLLGGLALLRAKLSAREGESTVALLRPAARVLPLATTGTLGT
jgi:DNA-directed RNA polymerase specialized sigma24 family protein